jgi:hypothetical protein
MYARNRMEENIRNIQNNPQTLIDALPRMIRAQTALIENYKALNLQQPTSLDVAIRLLKIPKKDLPSGRRALIKKVNDLINKAIATAEATISEKEISLKVMTTPAIIRALPFLTEISILGAENKTDIPMKYLLEKHSITWDEIRMGIMAFKSVEENIEAFKISNIEIIAVKRKLTLAQASALNKLLLTGSPHDISIKEAMLENLKCAIKIKETLYIFQEEVGRLYFVNPLHFLEYRRKEIFYPPLAAIYALASPIPAVNILTQFLVELSPQEFAEFEQAQHDIPAVIKQHLPELTPLDVEQLTAMIEETRKQVINYLNNAAMIGNEIGRICKSFSIQTDFNDWHLKIFTYLKNEILKLPEFLKDAVSNGMVKREFGIIQKALEDPDFYLAPNLEAVSNLEAEVMTVADLTNYFESPIPKEYHAKAVTPASTQIVETQYAASAAGVYSAAKAGANKAIAFLLKQKTLNNPGVADFLDKTGKDAFLIACSLNHLKVVRLLASNKFFSVDIVDGAGNSGSQLTTDTAIKAFIQEKLDARSQIGKKINHTIYYTPEPAVSASISQEKNIPEEKIVDYQQYFANANTSAIQPLLVTIDFKVNQLHAAEEKISIEMTTRINEIKTRALILEKSEHDCRGEAETILKKTTQDDHNNKSRLKALVKDHKNFIKKLTHCKALIRSILTSLQDELENKPVSIVEVISPLPTTSLRFFAAAAQSQALGTLQSDMDDIQFLLNIDINALSSQQEIKLFEADNITLSLQINALGFKVIQLLEKIIAAQSLPEREEARMLRNALLNSKGLYNENLFFAPDKDLLFEKFYSEFIEFTRLLLKSVKTHDYTLLEPSYFYQSLRAHDEMLRLQQQERIVNTLSDAERIAYTQELNKQQLAFSFYVLAAENTATPVLRGSAVQMVLMKLKNYGIYPSPQNTNPEQAPSPALANSHTHVRLGT